MGHCLGLAGATASLSFYSGKKSLLLSTSDLCEPSIPTAIKWGNKAGKKGWLYSCGARVPWQEKTE